jgi:hypothetical protein
MLTSKVVLQIFFSPQIENPQILGLILQTQFQKFLRRASPQVANPQIFLVPSPQIGNPQICKEKGSVSDPGPHWFALNTFFTCVSTF